MQERVKNLEINVEKILTNHLPHIQDAVDEVREEIGGLKDAFNFEINALKVTLARHIGIGVGAIAVVEVVLKMIK